MRKLIIFFVLLLTSMQGFSFFYSFDKMRCNGQLIEAGTNIAIVKQLCGDPIFEKKDENPFRTLVYMTYKASGESSRYYLLFRNDSLEICGLVGYNNGANIWENPSIDPSASDTSSD
jgi:hypothetical protein